MFFQLLPFHGQCYAIFKNIFRTIIIIHEQATCYKKKQGWMHNWCIQLPNYKARFLLLIKWQAQWSSDVPKEIGRGHSDTDYSMQPSTYSSKYKWEIAVTCFSIKDGTQSQKLAKQNPRYVQMTFNTICETSSSQFYQFILNTSTQQ